jgi:hypothetical protein
MGNAAVINDEQHQRLEVKLRREFGDIVLKSLADGRTAKRVKWAADEISSVARPADPTVGAKRDKGGNDYCHCTRCGGLFNREQVDDDYRCDDCGPVARSLRAQTDKKCVRAADGDKPAAEFSMNMLAEAVYALADQDERLKGKDNKGNLTGWISVRDIRASNEGRRHGS